MELYITLALLSVFFSLTLAIQIHLADKQQRYRYFVLVMGSIATWAFFSIFWLLSNPPALFVFYKLSFAGVITLPVFLFFFSIEYAGARVSMKSNKYRLCWIIPAISVLMVATNDWHGLFWKEIFPDTYYDGVLIYKYVPGTWYWPHTAFSYLLIVAALVNVFRGMWRKKKPWMFLLVLAGALVPIIANILVITEATQVDYTPIMLSFACVGFGWTITAGFYTESIKTLEQLQQRTNELNNLYDIVVKISEGLIQSEPHEVDDAINRSLQILGEFNAVDRAYIFEHDAKTDEVNNTYEWCREGIVAEKEHLQHIPYNFVSRWKDVFDRNEHIYIESVKDLEGEVYANEKSILEPQGIQSLIVVPMYFGRQFVGFLGFDSVASKKTWIHQVISLLRIVGNIIGGSILRMRFEKLLLMEKHKAEAASRAKSEFLANMSHEIRTPLNAILGFSRIAADDTHDEEVREHLEIVLNSGHSLMRLINDLLDFSKIEAGMLKLQPAEIRLSNVLAFTQQTFITQARQKGLDFRLELSPGADQSFVLDESRLRQVLFNLVGNAVKFTDQGMICLRADATNNGQDEKTRKIIIEVEDTGIGIAKEDQEAIFQIFNQLSRGVGRQYEGTGLGLNISKRLVELMNGTIELESEPGKGSTFRVILSAVPMSP